MERFVKIVNGYKPLTVFAKRSILDVWQCNEYAYEIGGLGESDFQETKFFLSLFSWIWVKHRFPLVGPFANFSEN